MSERRRRTKWTRAVSSRLSATALFFALLTILGGAVLFACSQTPTSVPIRTFERAQKVDVICLQVFGADAPRPLPQAACSPVPPDVIGDQLDNQLYALVTQTSRGEVAVVNLSAGRMVDQSHGVPGVNFLPVGAIPTDIAATPDGRMAFVASAEPNKFAIYGIPGHRILGDEAGRRDPEGATTLASWPVCALPQRPGSLTVVPRRAAPILATPDAGTPDAGDVDAGAGATDAGTSTPATNEPAYELVAVLPGDRTTPAKVITLDPRPFLRGSPRRLADGGPADDYGVGPALVPGRLEPCPITSAIELTDSTTLPATIPAGAVWEDGVKYVDGGVDLTCQMPDKPTHCGLRPCKCQATTPIDPAADGGAGQPDAGACEPDAGSTAPPELSLDLGPLDPPQPVAIARDDQTLYVADSAVPLIHVIDLRVAGAPRELQPLVVSSVADPSRAVSIRDIAISPPTREYKRFLYAVDRKEGSIAIFDVSDPESADRSPLRRPHPELNPFQPPDRIAFGAPVVAVAFARHDFPLTTVNKVPIDLANLDPRTPKAGILCNPNPNLDRVDPKPDLGFYYRANSTDPVIGLRPARLRGVFAFATLSNGQIVGIDVDDWDAPCRRPQELRGDAGAENVNASVGALAVPQPEPAEGDFDPYHAPIAPTESVTQEVFFPVSAPHRLRSAFLLRDDSLSGKHIPFLPSTPAIQSTGAPLPLFGPGSESTPRIRPTAARPSSGAAGTEDIGVRFSLDVPDTHFDQDWSVAYEGAIPGFEGLPATIATVDGYQSLVLSQPQARYCAKGVEDWATSGERANAITNALVAAGRQTHKEALNRRMVDYAQVVDELLPASDLYWRQQDLAAPNSCWEGGLAVSESLPLGDPARESIAVARHDVCAQAFGTVAEQNPNRDFPILEAYDDHLVVSRFAKVGNDKSVPTSRELIYKDPSNAAVLKLMRCCFHHQIKYSVRAASQWVTVGSVVGMLSHLTQGEGGRCVASCDPREALLNARAPSLPFSQGDFAPFRDSPLAMRNPSFSFFVQNGQNQQAGQVADVVPLRDTAWTFQTRGQFQPLVINLASTTTAVNPQSMRFIESLGQIAVVDGASQGLVLIDLAGVTIARAPYF
jgi:hypothetical protein